MRIIPEKPVRGLITFIYRHPYSVFGLSLLLSLAMAALAIKVPGRDGPGLTLKSSLQDLLPESAKSVQSMAVLESRLGSADLLIVTLKTNQFDRVKQELGGIAAALEADPDITKVDWRLDVDIIDKNALTIFATLDELESYYNDLTEQIRKAVSGSLALFDDNDGEKAEEPKDENAGVTYAWGELEADDGLSKIGRTFRKERANYREYFYNSAYTTIGLQVYPAKSSNNLQFCRHILDVVDRIVRTEVETRLGPIGENQIVERVDLGGGYRSALEQSDGIASDVVSSISVTVVILCLLIIVWFRSIRALFCVMVPLIFSICWTVGLVALSVGYLNLITAFIFAVLLGLGIDFGIHYFGRYREERAAGGDVLESMIVTHLECGEASALAALTTISAFVSLTLADFKGFSQFGAVAACGVALAVLSVMVVSPALCFVFERISPLKLMGYKVARDASGDVIRRRFPLGMRTVVIAVMVGVAGLVFGLERMDFEMNFNNLGEKTVKKKKDYEELQYGTSTATAPAVIFTNSAEEARSIYKQLDARMKEVGSECRIKSYQTIFSLIPEDQEAKGEWVQKICRKLKRKVKLFEGDARDGADELLKHCEPSPFTVEELPDWVKSKFSDKDGRLGEFIFVSMRGSSSDGEAALEFRDEMLRLKGADGEPPTVSGKPMIWADVLIAMKTDGMKTGIASLLTVFVLVFLFERRISSTLMIVMPLFLGLFFACGSMAVLGMKLNFFNMLAIPTMIGMGVDNAIHIYHRHQILGPGSVGYILKTTGSSSTLSSLTTMVGFASLLIANHLGLNSLGTLTILGMGVTLFACLIILGAALQWRDEHRKRLGIK